MTSTPPLPLCSPRRSPRRFVRLIASAWRCYKHWRIDVRILAVTMVIIGALVGNERCNRDATVWVGISDTRTAPRISMVIGTFVVTFAALGAWSLAVILAGYISTALALLIFVAIPVVAVVVFTFPFIFGISEDPAIKHLSRRDRKIPNAVVIGDVGSRGEAPEVGMAAAVMVMRWADRNHRVLACSASDPEISASYQKLGFAKIGTKHNRIFGTTDVLVRQPR